MKFLRIIMIYLMRNFYLISALSLLFLCAAAVEIRECPPDYFFDSQHCEKCQQNCKCAAQNQCTECIEGYTMFKGQCIICPQATGTLYGQCSGCCSRTQGTILSCIDCVPVANRYSFLFAGRCILSQGCFEVDSNGFCISCRTGFYDRDNICQSCDASCATCIDNDNCLTCAQGYYWKVADGGLCSACPSGCSSCTNDEACSDCLNSYYIYNDHCLPCPVNCQTCVGGSTCQTCTDGILVTNLCILCTDTTYGGSTGCVTCEQQNNFIQCVECEPEFFLDEDNGICRRCSDFIFGAERCRDSTTPTQCLNDYDSILTNRYYLVGISCVHNSKSCKKIADIDGNCSSCYDGYTLTGGACVQCPFTGCKTLNSSVVSNVCTCTQCDRGYYLSSGACLPCTSPLNCGVCPSNVCSACLTGYYLSGGACLVATVLNCLESKANSASLCAVCNDGYYLGDDQLCYLCQSNCLLCTDRITCTSCAPNNYLYNGYCISYPPNCLELVSSSISLSSSPKCNLCEHGYYLSEGFCLQCSVQLGTLGVCEGLCPIDYYIQNLMVDVVDSESFINPQNLILILTLLLIIISQ